MMFETISNVFDVDHVLEDEGKKPLPATITVTDQPTQQAQQLAEDDFNFARSQIKSAIEKASIVLDEMIDLSRESEHARAYEVANNVAANITSMAEALVKLHKESLKNQAAKEPSNVTNQNLVLTTDAVIAMIKNAK